MATDGTATEDNPLFPCPPTPTTRPVRSVLETFSHHFEEYMLQSGLKHHDSKSNTVHSVTDPKIRNTQTQKTAVVPLLNGEWSRYIGSHLQWTISVYTEGKAFENA